MQSKVIIVDIVQNLLYMKSNAHCIATDAISLKIVYNNSLIHQK